MTCPTGCAPKVTKGLQSIAGAKEVKLADFDKGLFTISFDAKTAISPDAFKKAVDGVVAECCDVEVLVASIDAVEKATN